MRLDPALAAVRAAVRGDLTDLPAGALVAVACSGGADSLALLAATAFEAPRAGFSAIALVVDHGRQPDSSGQAARTAAQARELGADARVLPVRVGGAGGPEAAARTARYAALDGAADELGAAAVLLGHTLDDQAESVLLGLARGSGGRSLAGIPPRRGRYRRPLLGLRRVTTAAACAAAGLEPWTDPDNADPAYARTRVRRDALPALEAALGPGMAEALARTARLLRQDSDVLDELAARAGAACTGADGSLDVAGLARLPAPLRSRVIRGAALQGGVPGGALSAVHINAVDALVTGWHGQGSVALPRGSSAARTSGRLRIAPAPPAGRPAGDQTSVATGSVRRGAHRVYDDDIESVVISAPEIIDKIAELAKVISADYADREVLLVGVLKGAVMMMADLSRALSVPTTMEFMAVSSYGSTTSSSGVVRILKDLDRDIAGQHVLLVEDVIDSGLTLSWLMKNLRSRGPASLEVCTLLRKPDAAAAAVPVRYVGFEIPNRFVVGYGLDYAERYRDLPYIGMLRPEVYAD